ncbi:GFA family protein [Teredinibacter turnerae]|uniref:GFA family protein n=1 Tax=Teredinibacter turnerae TaxID=2426 RepID=UPI0009E45C19
MGGIFSTVRNKVGDSIEMIKGECVCGVVRFTISGPTSQVILCHCSICRKSVGAGGIPIIIASNKFFNWESGLDSIKSWSKPVGDWSTNFCRVCGSPLPRENDSNSMAIPAGLITQGGDDLKVQHHIYSNYKPAWDEIGDDGVIHPEAFGSSTGER